MKEFFKYWLIIVFCVLTIFALTWVAGAMLRMGSCNDAPMCKPAEKAP